MRLLFLIVFALSLTACSSVSGESSTEALPPGDAGRGTALFIQSVNGAPACSTCHTLDGSSLIGPSMQGFAIRAAARIEGTSAEDYTHVSIIQPNAFIAPGFSNVMYAQYERRLSPQQIADLIAYLLTV